MKLFDKYGNVMMEISSLERRGDDIVIKGKMMGSMPGTFYLKPAEAWSVLSLLTWKLVRYLPLFLYKAWRQSRPKHAEPGRRRTPA